MFWFILVFAAVAVSIIIIIKRPLWGTLASSMCGLTIGLKAGALFNTGRWPTFVEGLILLGLTGLSCVVMRRKQQAWEKAHPPYRWLKAREKLEALIRELQKLQTE